MPKRGTNKQTNEPPARHGATSQREPFERRAAPDVCNRRARNLQPMRRGDNENARPFYFAAF